MTSSPSEHDLTDDSGTESPNSPSVPLADSPFGPPSGSTQAGARAAAPRQPSSPLAHSSMTASSTPLGPTAAARRPMQSSMSSRGALPQDLQDRMRAFQLGRQGAPPKAPDAGQGAAATKVNVPQAGPGGIPLGFQPPGRPAAQGSNSSPAVPKTGGPSLAQKRGIPSLGGLPAGPGAPGAAAGGRRKPGPGLTLSQMGAGTAPGTDTPQSGQQSGSLLDKYSDFIDKKTGALRFKGKATLTSQGVEFESGATFNISLDEVDTLDELGKGNYGTVYKVRHSRPRIRIPGQGLAGNKNRHPELNPAPTHAAVTSTQRNADGTTGIVMAMKEMRLELEDSKFQTIIMELDILHRCVSPYIVEFYGAFFQEGAVYLCMEFMDGGSMDKLYGDGVPEDILRKVTLATTLGLKCLKDDHNIIHRDVKPTNILVNGKGQIKLCDFGVSGNLVASIAKTNIGCQSYMAPERISSGGVAQAGAGATGGGTYSVQSDIWSLGLTVIECALGRYPYPPETYDNIFSQLSAIVDGEPPALPKDTFSDAAHDFVRGCLDKIPKRRPTYAALLAHPWLAPMVKPATISEEDEEAAEAGAAMPTGEAAPGVSTAGGLGTLDPATGQTTDKEVSDWVHMAQERKASGKTGKPSKPALHAAPLDAVSSPTVEAK